MAKEIYSLSLDSIKLLCGLIRDLASVSEGIDNLHLADDKTFSNIHIKDLIDQCLEDANTEAQKLVGALTHLTCKETTVQPTLDNSEINVIYLYSADGNPPYQQFLKISDTKLVDLGSTSINLTDYLTITSAASTYAKQTDFKTLSDEVSGIKTKIGTETLTTTATTLTGAINEVANKSTIVSLTKAEYDALSTKDPETYYIITDDEQSVSITPSISSSSTNSEVPTAKAVYDKYNIHDLSEAYKNVITNPLLVDVNNPDNIYNKDGLVTRDTTEDTSNFVIPSDCSWGIREIFWKSGGNLINKLTGMDLNNKPAEWVNVLSGTSTSYQWSGWQRVVTTKVADVPLTAITWESTSIISSGAANYEVRNGICYVYFRGNPIIQSEHANGRVLASGLPKPTTPGFYMTGIWDLSTSVLLQVNTEGKLLIWSDYTNNGKNIHFSFSYPVAES